MTLSQIDDLAPGSSNLVITPEKLSLFYSKYRIDQEVCYFVGEYQFRVSDIGSLFSFYSLICAGDGEHADFANHITYCRYLRL